MLNFERPLIVAGMCCGTMTELCFTCTFFLLKSEWVLPLHLGLTLCTRRLDALLLSVGVHLL